MTRLNEIIFAASTDGPDKLKDPAAEERRRLLKAARTADALGSSMIGASLRAQARKTRASNAT